MTRGAQSLSILIVDDESEFAATLAERLSLRKHTAAVACDGESALAMLQAQNSDGARGIDSFDLVLLDMFLPGIHGLEVLRAIQTLRPDLPVILLTGQAGGEEETKALCLGARCCLSKPVNLRELLALFDRLKKETACA